MRGIVVDIKGRYAVALTKDGSFVRIKNTGELEIGNEVDTQPAEYLKAGFMMKAATIAAAFLVTLGGFGAYTYSIPYSYVDVDINPSVGITVNIFDRIIHASGLNDDGKQLIEFERLKNRKLEDGVEAILESAVVKGYLKEEDTNAILLTVSSKNEKKVDSLEENLLKVTDAQLEARGIKSEIGVENVTPEQHNEAVSLGISPGKKKLIEKLVEAKPELESESRESLSEMSVKDIMKSIKESRKDDKEENKGKNKENDKDRDRDKEKDKDKGKDKEKEVQNRDLGKDSNKNNNKSNNKDDNKDNNKNSKKDSRDENEEKLSSNSEKIKAQLEKLSRDWINWITRNNTVREQNNKKDPEQGNNAVSDRNKNSDSSKKDTYGNSGKDKDRDSDNKSSNGKKNNLDNDKRDKTNDDRRQNGSRDKR